MFAFVLSGGTIPVTSGTEAPTMEEEEGKAMEDIASGIPRHRWLMELLNDGIPLLMISSLPVLASFRSNFTGAADVLQF